ncbi:MAG: DUF4976 domain-containing protein, partial [bacterium]|nr:DUF4976 domain-containing protein [bacterium]
LEKPNREWERPAVMTFMRGNHAARSDRYRYIRYANGEEELYDHDHDPEEWTNLAGDPAYKPVIAELARWLPRSNAPGALLKKAFVFDPETYTWRRRADNRGER